MARFKIVGKAYLDIGEEWEHTEMTQGPQGRSHRHRFRVHSFIDCDPMSPTHDPSRYNYPNEFIVTTRKDPRYPQDVILYSAPNPEMIPLDAEAEELLQALPQGTAPMSEAAFPTMIPSPSTPGPIAPAAKSEALVEVDKLEKIMSEMEGFKALMQGQIDELTHQNRLLREQLAEAETAEAPPTPAPAGLTLGA